MGGGGGKGLNLYRVKDNPQRPTVFLCVRKQTSDGLFWCGARDWIIRNSDALALIYGDQAPAAVRNMNKTHALCIQVMHIFLIKSFSGDARFERGD